MGVYVVVADRFEKFSRQDNVLAYGVLLKALKDSGQAKLKGWKLVAGQGLGTKEVNHVYRLGIARGYAEEFSHWHVGMDAVPADKALSHKDKTENVLISVPEKESDGIYVRIPRAFGHPFHEHLDSDSTLTWTLIPRPLGH